MSPFISFVHNVEEFVVEAKGLIKVPKRVAMESLEKGTFPRVSHVLELHNLALTVGCSLWFKLHFLLHDMCAPPVPRLNFFLSTPLFLVTKVEVNEW
jgi:hypothetical protein